MSPVSGAHRSSRPSAPPVNMPTPSLATERILPVSGSIREKPETRAGVSAVSTGSGSRISCSSASHLDAPTAGLPVRRPASWRIASLGYSSQHWRRELQCLADVSCQRVSCIAVISQQIIHLPALNAGQDPPDIGEQIVQFASTSSAVKVTGKSFADVGVGCRGRPASRVTDFEAVDELAVRELRRYCNAVSRLLRTSYCRSWAVYQSPPALLRSDHPVRSASRSATSASLSSRLPECLCGIAVEQSVVREYG